MCCHCAHAVRVVPAIILCLLGLTLPVGAAVGETITMHKLSNAPVLDGDGKDWADVPWTRIALKPSRSGVTTPVDSVDIKGGVHGDYVYFLVEWNDTTEDKIHKPWVWSKESNKYVAGPQREDRFAMQFVMEGDYTTNWLSGSSFKADMWHWKSVRSNPIDLVHDKMTIVSARKVAKARAFPADNNGEIYIARPSDDGDKLYTTMRYHKLDKDVMPKYVMATDSPKGSVADVGVKGVWRDGRWRLEMRRKRDTGNADDVVFPTSGTLAGGIAVYDHSADDDHMISDTLEFQF